uniref:Uncharacterized protein n=1 Tax=Arundo donax TaxID=35708 RepID=A0A0A9DBI6_ARUDO
MNGIAGHDDAIPLFVAGRGSSVMDMKLIAEPEMIPWFMEVKPQLHHHGCHLNLPAACMRALAWTKLLMQQQSCTFTRIVMSLEHLTDSISHVVSDSIL